jgi:hypothetical protein
MREPVRLFFDNCRTEPCDWWFRFERGRIQADAKQKILKDIHSERPENSFGVWKNSRGSGRWFLPRSLSQ